MNAKHGDERFDIISLTPKRAKQFVENAAPNRTTLPSRVERFEDVILNGQWKLAKPPIS